MAINNNCHTETELDQWVDLYAEVDLSKLDDDELSQ